MLTLLPYDICRCLGESVVDGSAVCGERTECLRYQAAMQGSNGERVPYTSILRGSMMAVCEYKITNEDGEI